MVFKYLVPLLDQIDYNSPEVIRNIWKVRQVCERLRKLLRREWAYTSVLEKFYHAVLQSVLLFGAETWVQRLEGVHMGFLKQVKKSKESG